TPLFRGQSLAGKILYSPRILFEGFGSNIALNKSLKTLNLENESLRAQLEDLKNEPIVASEDGYLRASVFLQHPLKGRAVLSLDAGRVHGVRPAGAVLAAEGIFLGQINALEEKMSWVKTVFDTDWQLPVMIGENKVSGLFIGSSHPTVSLISKSQTVEVGDRVVLAAEGLPLSLTLGFVESLEEAPADPFKEARLSIPYKLADLRRVLIQSR
ncbi:MAG: rod shape-determining protein MreC, partial [Candidatus Harrisonbacteria bacterium]|nr:rod shape-determining protein MreC [Candidatus Harrisonbacteria bacterium]